MHKMLTRFMAVAALLCTASTAWAVTFPNVTCPDSVSTVQIQNYNNPSGCLPAIGDTVMGVGGIIVGFDPIATGFDAFIQVTGGGPFSGVDVFFHSLNPQSTPLSLALGDSIVVEWMRVGEFGGATQVLAPNNNFTAPNGIVRKVSSGNPLPPFFVGTTTQLKEVPALLPAFAFAEQYEGCLVKITDATVVRRTSLTGGLGANNGFLIVDPNAPSDSVFIDGNKLTVYAPPPVGTAILSVQGILNQTSRGYRIMLRNGNDIVVNTPPNVVDAYPITDNLIRVKFDRDITAGSGTNLTNYSLASFGSIDGAAMVGGDAVDVSITNGLAHGDIEVVTVNGVVGLAAGQPMTTPQSRTFVNGLLTAEEIQRANPDSLSATPPCVDRSRFAGPGGQITQGPVGTKASMAATVAARYGALYYMADPSTAKRTGVAAFSPPATLTQGRMYRLTGGVQEFFGESEFSNITEVQDLGVGSLPAVKDLTVGQARADTCDYSNVLVDGEDYEGRIVRLQFVKVVQRFTPLPTNGFHVADQSFPDTIFIQNLSGVLGAGSASPPLGQLVTVTGAMHYESGSFRVCPATLGDIQDHGVAGVGGSGGKLSFAIAPNPSRRATIHWTLPQAENVEIAIFDVAGRQVAEIQSGQMPAGTYSRDWAGTDDAGRELNAGVYFARMKAGALNQTLRTVFLGR